MSYDNPVKREVVERIAAEISARDSVQVKAVEFDCGHEVGVKVDFPDGARHAVRYRCDDAEKVRGLIEAGVAKCLAWHAENVRQA